jgi:putative NADH-flavin reductase
VRIVIFGAAGATGRALVTQALTQGHQVTAFVRTPAKFDSKHAGLNMVQGDVADAAAVERALFGQDAVLCALGAATPLKRDQTLVNGNHQPRPRDEARVPPSRSHDGHHCCSMA